MIWTCISLITIFRTETNLSHLQVYFTQLTFSHTIYMDLRVEWKQQIYLFWNAFVSMQIFVVLLLDLLLVDNFVSTTLMAHHKCNPSWRSPKTTLDIRRSLGSLKLLSGLKSSPNLGVQGLDWLGPQRFVRSQWSLNLAISNATIDMFIGSGL